MKRREQSITQHVTVFEEGDSIGSVDYAIDIISDKIRRTLTYDFQTGDAKVTVTIEQA